MKLSHIHLTLSVFLAILSAKANCQDNSWQNIGPYMGYINSMAMDNAYPDTLYACCPYGIYKSVDGAETWIKTSLTDIAINSVIVSQISPNILIANNDSSIYKSENYGETWNEIWRSERTIGAIAIDPFDDLSIWAGVNIGITGYSDNLFHTKNGGTVWESVSWGAEETKLQSVLSINFDQSNDSVMYVCGWGDTYHVDGGLFVSNDKGKTWTNHRLGLCSTNNGLAIASTPKGYEPHAVFVLVNACKTYKQLFKSLDYGITWDELEMLTYQDITLQRDYIDDSPNVMAINPASPKWLIFGANYKSIASLIAYDIEKDSWHYYPETPLRNPTSLLMHTNVWYLSFNNDGVFRYSDIDSTWVMKNQGMNDVEIFDLISYPNDPDKILAAIDGSLAKTYDAGKTWSKINSSFHAIALNMQDTSMIFAGNGPKNYPNFMDPFYCYESTNGADSWEGHKIFTRGGLSDFGYTMWTGDILIFPDNSDRILVGVDGGGGCGEGLYMSTDIGDSWDKKFSTGVSTIAMDPINSEIIYLGTTNLGYVYRSENSGVSWTKISSGFVSSVWDLSIDKNNQVFAATSSGLYKWEGNENWSLVQGFPETNTTSIIIDNHPEVPVYYAGTESHGIIMSDNNGATWASFNKGLNKLNVTALRMNDSYPRNLYAGTKDGGIWMTMLKGNASFTSIFHEPKISFNIFPNPNDGNFSIIVDGNSEIKGNLKIINILGEVVYFKSNIKINPPKAYEVCIGNVPTGNYILVFTDSKISINKKVLIKN